MSSATSGAYLIGAARRTGTASFTGIEAATGKALDGDFAITTADDIAQACALAGAAFDAYREITPEARAAFLDAIAAARPWRRTSVAPWPRAVAHRRCAACAAAEVLRESAQALADGRIFRGARICGLRSKPELSRTSPFHTTSVLAHK